MDDLLKMFGLEVIPMYCLDESWFFKEFQGSWYYRDTRNSAASWQYFAGPSENMNLIKKSDLTWHYPLIRERVEFLGNIDTYGEVGPDETLKLLTNNNVMMQTLLLKYLNFKKGKTI